MVQRDIYAYFWIGRELLPSTQRQLWLAHLRHSDRARRKCPRNRRDRKVGEVVVVGKPRFSLRSGMISWVSANNLRPSTAGEGTKLASFLTLYPGCGILNGLGHLYFLAL